MKNKLGIFTALILSLIIAGSVFAAPENVSAKKLSAAAAKAKVSKTANTKKRRHRRHKRKVMKKTIAPTPKKS